MDAKGQSILEVVFVLPMLFLFVGLLFKLNMGIQMAINNTQYARSQVYVLTANSPDYPRLEFRYYRDMFYQRQQDLMVLGVADPSAIPDDDADEMLPIPQTVKVTRNSTITGSSQPGEVTLRSEVRVRDTSAICTPLHIALNTNGVGLPNDGRWPFGKKPVCSYGGTWIGDY